MKIVLTYHFLELLINFLKKHYRIIISLLIISVGIILRIKLFINNNSFIFDETALAANVISLEWKNLFNPLEYEQVCPPLCLALFKIFHTATKNLLPYEASFRIIPFLCGLFMLPAFAYLLKILNNKIYFIWTGLLLLALNKTAIIYSCTIKQYSVELFITICLLILFYKTNINQLSNKKLLFLFLLISIIPFLSFVSYFIIFSGMLLWFINCYKTKSLKKFFKFAFIPLIFFILFYTFYYKNVFIAQSSFMFNYWQNTNPHFLNSDNFIFNVKFYLMNLLKLQMPYNYTIDNITHFLMKNFYLLCGIILFYQIKLKNYKNILLILLPIIITIISGFFFYPFVERCILFILPCLIIFISLVLSPIKQTKYITVLFIIVIFNLLNNIYINSKSSFPQSIKSLYQVLTQYNPEMKNIFATKCCYVAYSGKSTLLYNLDIWKNFDENEFNNFIQNLPAGDYYIYLPYDRYKSDYNEEILSYLKNSKLVKIAKIHFEDPHKAEFTAHIIKK